MRCNSLRIWEKFIWCLFLIATFCPSAFAIISSQRSHAGLDVPVHLFLGKLQTGKSWNTPNLIELTPKLRLGTCISAPQSTENSLLKIWVLLWVLGFFSSKNEQKSKWSVMLNIGMEMPFFFSAEVVPLGIMECKKE